MGIKRVVVVGGGLAGLAAARELLNSGLDVLVLEASHVLGGRIKQITGFVPWPVELGPEFLHGQQNSSIVCIANELDCQLRELPYPDCYYIGSERRFIKNEEAQEHTDIQTAHRIFSELVGENPPFPDINMHEFLRNKGVNDTVIQLSQSIYANDFGCSLKELGVGECIEEAKQWIYGDTYMILDRPLSCIINHLSKGVKVLLNHAVEVIDYTSNLAVLHCKGGATFEADYVILTVPVKILEKQTINFRPTLPSAKMKAASSIGMSNAIKILMAFSHCFWPKDMFDVVCTDCFIPEIWTVQHTRDNGSSLGKHLLVGFIAGEAAVVCSKLSPEEIITETLLQVDQIFGESVSENAHVNIQLTWNNTVGFYTKASTQECNVEAQPASFYFEGGYIVDWSKERFIMGGYSHPSVNAQGARQALAMPVMGKLFFAGEATHPGVNPCMQAAVDTGVRAAREVKGSIMD